MGKLTALLKGDYKNISRDSILILVSIAPVLILLLLRFGIPLISALLLDKLSFDLSIYYPLIVSFMMQLTPMMFGMITGFMILDERDEDLLIYLSITPLGKTGYLGFKLLSPVFMSFIFTLILFVFNGLVPFSGIRAVPVALLIAMEAPIIALFLAAFAGNKIEGLALGKAYGIILLAPFAAWFIKSNLQFVAGILPTFWVSKGYLLQGGSVTLFWFYIGMGFVVHLIYILVFLKIFRNKAY